MKSSGPARFAAKQKSGVGLHEGQGQVQGKTATEKKFVRK
jgi:hypothetical protein